MHVDEKLARVVEVEQIPLSYRAEWSGETRIVAEVRNFGGGETLTRKVGEKDLAICRLEGILLTRDMVRQPRVGDPVTIGVTLHEMLDEDPDAPPVAIARRRRVRISAFLVEEEFRHGCDKHSIQDPMPADAKLVGAEFDYQNQWLVLTFESSEWPEGTEDWNPVVVRHAPEVPQA